MRVSGDIEWRWADPVGQQRLVREDELRASLAGGLIPPNAPVWREGWKDWQPAYAVPELTTSALAAANGVVLNIPPPPLGVLGAQKDMEKEGARLGIGPSRASKHPEPPPPPPRYVPAPTHAPPSAPGSGPSVAHAVVPPSPSSTRTVGLLDKSKTAAAGPSNNGVAREEKKDERKESFPTTIGVPALPQASLPLNATPTPAPPPVTANPVPLVTARTVPAAPPPLPPKTSRPPPPLSKKKNKTLIMYGGAPTAGPSSEKVAPPINVPGPTSQSPQAITRPPPADGSAEVAAPSIPKAPAPPSIRSDAEAIEELSSSILLEDRDSEAIVPSNSMPPVQATPAPKPVARVRSGTLLGFPVPTAAAATEVAPSEPAAESSRALEASFSDEMPAGVPSSRIVHDLRELMRGPKQKYFWPVAGVLGGVAFLGIISLVIGVTRGEPEKELNVTAPASGTLAKGTSPATTVARGPRSPSPAQTAQAPSAIAQSSSPAAATAPCTLAGVSHTIAPRALVPTGVEVRAAGETIGMGFALSPKDGMALEIDASSLTVGPPARTHAPEALKRVVPDLSSGRLNALGETDRKERLHGRRAVPGPVYIDIGVAEGSLVWAPHLKDAYSKLWPLDGDAPVEALRGVAIETKGERGFAVTFRRTGAIWTGVALGDKTLTPRGPLFRIAGLGPVVGSPTIAASAGSVLIAWADRPSPTDMWGIRWAKFTPGEAPGDGVLFHPPAGGLGEHMMSPWLTPAGAGRFLLLWTEGPVSAHQVRGQTLTVEGAPLGEAITVSAEGMNAGQAQAAVLADGRGVVSFLASKGKGYEVVAAPMVCPPAK